MAKRKASTGNRGKPKIPKMEPKIESDFSHRTPTVAGHSDLPSPPPGFLSVSTYTPTVPARYQTRQSLLGQCAPSSRTPLRCAVRNVKQVSKSPADLNQKDEHPSPSSTFNCTEIAAIKADDSFDPDEVVSAVDSALVTVNCYRVKKEMAPLLQSIFSKYGDIARECTSESIYIRSRLLEGVCDVYQGLEKTTYILITPMELKSMLAVMGDLERAGVDVRWLHGRLDEISEALKLSKGYSTLKEAQTRNRDATGREKKELKALRDALAAKEARVAAMEAKGEKINETIFVTRAKMKCFNQRSLVNGLL